MHDWYDWAKDIGLPLLTGGGSVVVGAVAIYVARQSHELARQVRKDELTREAGAAEERYRAQLGHFIETAVTSLVAYGNAVEKHAAVVNVESQMHGAAQARLVLLNAVAEGDDALPTQAAFKVFHELGHNRQWRVRASVAGLLAGGLAQTLARQKPGADIAAEIRGYIPKEERNYAEYA